MVFVLSLLTQTIKLFDTVIAIVTSDPSRHKVGGMQNWHESAKRVHEKEQRDT
jgi:hypothetical protein